MEMKKYKLGDLGKIVTGKTPRTSIEENYGGDIPFITPSDDLSVKDIREVSKKITELGLKEVKNCLLPPRSICVSCIGSDMGKVVMTSVPSVTNQQFNSIIPNESFDADYIYYLMIPIGQQMKNKLGKQSTAVPIVSKSQFSDIDVSIICDIKDQEKVSSVLSSIDERIENLRAQNRVLEQTAKTIYDYTFLQCAGHQTTYNKNLNRNIPAEWEIDNLYRIADFTNGLACQKYRPITEKEKLPVIKIREMHDGVTADTEFVRSDIPEKVIVNPGDLLFSWSASLEVMMWNGVKGGLNQHIFKVTPKEYFSLYFVYFQLKDYIGNFKRMAEARKTTMGHITTDHLNQSRIAIPDEETMKRFSSQVTPLFKKQLVNSQQIETLTTQRNTLLPLLMTGQIEV